MPRSLHCFSSTPQTTRVTSQSSRDRGFASVSSTQRAPCLPSPSSPFLWLQYSAGSSAGHPPDTPGCPPKGHVDPTQPQPPASLGLLSPCRLEEALTESRSELQGGKRPCLSLEKQGGLKSLVPILLFLFPLFIYLLLFFFGGIIRWLEKAIWKHNCRNCCDFRLSLQSLALSSPDGLAERASSSSLAPRGPPLPSLPLPCRILLPARGSQWEAVPLPRPGKGGSWARPPPRRETRSPCLLWKMKTMHSPRPGALGKRRCVQVGVGAGAAPRRWLGGHKFAAGEQNVPVCKP